MKSDVGQAGRQRRHHERSFKAKLIEQSLAPGASVSAIALDNGINANMLFKWRREWRRQASSASARPILLPVHLAPEAARQPAPGLLVARGESCEASSSIIELEVAGAKLCLRDGVHEDSLRKVLRALREAA